VLWFVGWINQEAFIDWSFWCGQVWFTVSWRYIFEFRYSGYTGESVCLSFTVDANSLCHGLTISQNFGIYFLSNSWTVFGGFFDVRLGSWWSLNSFRGFGVWGSSSMAGWYWYDGLFTFRCLFNNWCNSLDQRSSCDLFVDNCFTIGKVLSGGWWSIWWNTGWSDGAWSSHGWAGNSFAVNGMIEWY